MSSVLTRTVARVLLLPTLVIAIAILVKGYADSGDGFTAGMVAALAVLAQYAAFGHGPVDAALPVRLAPAAAFAGLALALGVGVLPVALGEPLFSHFPGPGSAVWKVGTLELITPVLFDVGVFLLVCGAALGIIGALARAADPGEPA